VRLERSMIFSDDRTTKDALLNSLGEEQAAVWARFLAMSTRSALYVLVIVLALALLFIIVVFGAIVFLVYRDRSHGPSYFPSSTQARRQLPINE
jgi:hypothetical protein